MWQDIANAVAGIELVCSMLPMVLRGRSKLALSGALTTAGLIVFSVTFATLGLTLSAITTGIQSGLWAYIVVRWGRKSEPVSENKNSKPKKSDIESFCSDSKCYKRHPNGIHESKKVDLPPCSEECYTGPNCPHRDPIDRCGPYCFGECCAESMLCTNECVQPCRNPNHGIMFPGQGDGVGVGP